MKKLSENADPKQKKPHSTPSEKLVRITFEAPASLRKSFKLKAGENDRSVRDVLCELMDQYVKGGGK